ncbi:hypothetical protein ABE547_10120 [Dorea sp. YH-dor226]|uniref:hypothetical protein n=1 Tax=Dorea sp. YH-dor226 TaxID=3151119 RepID=UPI003242B7A6
MLFQKMESVYIGYDMSLCGDIRDALGREGIKYKCRVHNHDTQFLGNGRGTSRGTAGSVGMNRNYMNQYEILVPAKDREQAEYIIRSIHQKERAGI